MKRRTLEKQGLVIGAFLFTLLGMKIRDIQFKVMVNKECKAIREGKYDDLIQQKLGL